MSSPSENESSTNQPVLVPGEDYVMEGPYMVFTAAYHLKRGYCCGNGCKNCPYKNAGEGR